MHPRLLERLILAMTQALMRSTRATRIVQCKNFKKWYSAKPFSVIEKDPAALKALAASLPELGPYPTYSKYVNPSHFYQNTVMNQWISKKAHPITLRQLANFGKKLTEEKVLSSANFVRLEIAIRISKKLKDLQVLPFAAVSNHHLVRVYESYYNIFENFRKIKPITTMAENDEFCQLLSKLLQDNVASLPHLIMGAIECSMVESMTPEQLDEFMSATLRARISRRLLCEEHLSLTDKFQNANVEKDEHDYIGDVFYKCSAKENLKVCGEELALGFAKTLFPEGFLMPELIIEGEDVKFQFMVTHLRYLFGEILRNSYESTMANFVRNHADKPSEFFHKNRPPPIKVAIVSNKHYVNFRFSDRGGGIQGDTKDLIWSWYKPEHIARQSLRNMHKLPGLQLANDYKPAEYLTEAPIELYEPANDLLNLTSLSALDQSGYFKTNSKSSLQNIIKRPSNFHLNMGLAMCKVYADYWNGNLVMNSLDNYGVDTYLTLQRLGTNQDLNLDKA